MIQIVKNFKKAILWKQGKTDEIDDFDEVHKDYVATICDLGKFQLMKPYKR